MKKKDEPEPITLTGDEAEALKSRILSSNLSESDQTLMAGLISFTLWLQAQLGWAKLSIQRLRRLFGFSTEKKSVQSR